MNIALIGPSGTGKGTHAARLSAQCNLRHVAAGDLLRHNLESHSAPGILARKYMEQGELVPDELVDTMIDGWVRNLGRDSGALFDGFPRTAYQAGFLDGLLDQLNRALDAVIYLRVADGEIVNRLANRLICRSCQAPYHLTLKPPLNPGVCDRCGGELYRRPDDTTDRARIRLRVFHRTTGPVLEHYAERGKLAIIGGEGTFDEVGARVAEAVAAVQRSSYTFATLQDVKAIIAETGAEPPPHRIARPSLDLVLLGGPGSGKGTQAELLSKALNLPHIATGDLFRDNLRQATDLGKLARTYMDRGELVPDDVTEAMVEERLARSDTHEGFILDGFPRTLPQAAALMEMTARLQRRVAGVLYVNVSDEAIVRRLSGRLICRSCQAPYHVVFNPPRKSGACDHCGGELFRRSDDDPNTVRARLKSYHGQTEPLIEFYRKAGLLHEIAGEGEVAQVFERCRSAARPLAKTRETAPSTR